VACSHVERTAILDDIAWPRRRAAASRTPVAAGSEPVRSASRRRGPVGFLVAITVDDAYLDGSTHSSSTHGFLRLPAAIDLKATPCCAADRRRPAGANAVRREVHARVDLMPGYVQRRPPCPCGRPASPPRRCAVAWAMARWRSALAELRAALRIFERGRSRAPTWRRRRHGGDRETAIDCCSNRSASGARPGQVAMAALRTVTDVTFWSGSRRLACLVGSAARQRA